MIRESFIVYLSIVLERTYLYYRYYFSTFLWFLFVIFRRDPKKGGDKYRRSNVPDFTKNLVAYLIVYRTPTVHTIRTQFRRIVDVIQIHHK